MTIDRIIARIRSYARGLRRPAAVEAEMLDEFRQHVELRTRDLVASGFTPEEAARQARVEFGHIDTHREQALASRGLTVLDHFRFSHLDVKLALRMLAKYPGLSMVSVIGMTVAIAIAAGGYAAVGALLNRSLPLDEGDRIVTVQNPNLLYGESGAERRAVDEYLQWRRELKSVQDFTAFSDEKRNLVLREGVTDIVDVARMTASGFRVARVAPILGRPLQDEDERAGAQPVVVIGYDEWQRHFDADAEIIGRQLRLGTVVHTVVGVMPENYRFPVNHQYWVALQLDGATYERGVRLTHMFGRLVPGVTMKNAQAELATIHSRASAAEPEPRGHLQPQVLPYTYPYSGITSAAAAMQLQAIKLAIALLLVVVAVNVSVLVYARTATRMGEISIRTALGASRKRVVTQLFVEAVVLSGIAALLGLGLASFVLAKVNALNSPSAPFWMEYRLSASLVLYVAALALLAGVIVGVLPALKVTGRRVQAGLQQMSARGSQMQLGRIWTAMIVLQVAVAVAALPYAIYLATASLQRAVAPERYPADEIVRTYVSLEGGGASTVSSATFDEYKARLLTGTQEFLRRVDAEPDIAGVTITRGFPGYEWQVHAEVEGGSTLVVQYNDFGVDLLPLFDQPIVAGRGFMSSDAGEGGSAVIVNEALAVAIAGRPETALGRRIRLVQPAANGIDAPENRWLDVVGVVPNFTDTEGLDPNPDPLLYRPLSLESAVSSSYAVQIVLRLRGDAGEQVAGRLRQVAAAVDPALQVTNTRSAADMRRESRQAFRFLGIGVAALTLSVLLLSSAGIYAMISFTVARRRREIGIRAALGAGARQVITGIFARAGAQLGAGILGGLVVALLLDIVAGGMLQGRRLVVLLPLVAAIMMAVGLLAALGPARRGLAVQPTEAMRGD